MRVVTPTFGGVVAGLVLALGLAGCDGNGEDFVDGPPRFSSEPTVLPGEQLALGTTETVAVSGVYRVPAGATFITTRCIGEAAVTIEAIPGNPVTNTCDGDGTSSQTNTVAGVDEVYYEVTDGSFARVTIS